MATKRMKGPSTGPSNQAQLRFNEDACADKVAETGHNYFWGVSNTEGLLGALNTAKKCGKFKPVLVFNTDAVVHYVAFGASGVAAPSSGANGVPIMPATGIVLASGTNEYLRSDSATVFGYVSNENVVDGADQGSV